MWTILCFLAWDIRRRLTYYCLLQLQQGKAPNTCRDLALDPAELEAAFNEKTKMIIVSSPNNPTGKVSYSTIGQNLPCYTICTFCMEPGNSLWMNFHQHYKGGGWWYFLVKKPCNTCIYCLDLFECCLLPDSTHRCSVEPSLKSWPICVDVMMSCVSAMKCMSGWSTRDTSTSE